MEGTFCVYQHNRTMTPMMKLVRNGCFVVLFAFGVLLPQGGAHAATNEEILKLIQSLMTQIQELQKQLDAVRGDVRETLKEGLHEGMTDSDIEKIQALLATDPLIYPDGRVTGYFGPLTKDAVRRFQTRHSLEATGVVDGETHELLVEYFNERQNGKIPPGLLRAPGIMKKIEDRYGSRCENRGHGNDTLCKKIKKGVTPIVKPPVQEDDFDTEVEIINGKVVLDFTYDDEDYTVKVGDIDVNDLLDAVADELGEDVDDLDDTLVDQVKKAFKDAKNDYEDNLDDFNVEVDVDSGTTSLEFEFDGDDYSVTVTSTDEDDILEAVADELDEDDVEDLDEDLVEAIKKALDDDDSSGDGDWDNVEVEIDDDETTVRFEYDGDDYDVTVDSTDEDDVIDEIADEIGEDSDDLDDDFLDEVKDKLEDALNDAEGDESESDAEDAIDDARDAIESAEGAIDDADGNTDEAEDLLDEANDLLDDAEDAFDDEDWEEAEDLADEAKDKAEEAEDAL